MSMRKRLRAAIEECGERFTVEDAAALNYARVKGWEREP